MPKKSKSRVRHKLPNGCSRSEISVTPKTWNVLKKISGPWRIHYRFYDPSRPKPHQVTLKDMNKYLDIEARKEATKFLIDAEKTMLATGYNPFIKKTVIQREGKYDLEPTTLFIHALKGAVARMQLNKRTRHEMNNYIIKRFEEAAVRLDLSMMTISEVKRRHIIYILDKVRETYPRFSNNTFNHFRTYLQMIFVELLEIEAVETNIINDIKVKSIEHKTRKVLSPAERTFINSLLSEKYPAFHRFLNIFFHSGGRITELMKVKGSDVDLPGQRYKTTILKGQNPKSVWRTIKTVALPFWASAMEGCAPNDHVFSVGLKSGPKQIREDQITKRWYRLIKQKVFEIDGKKTQITADFYSLKHLNTTETMDLLENSIEAPENVAAAQNGHTSTAMVVKIYDVKNSERKHKKLKQINNPFA